MTRPRGLPALGRRLAAGVLVAALVMGAIEGLLYGIGVPTGTPPLVARRWRAEGPPFALDGATVRPTFQDEYAIGPFPVAPGPAGPRVMVFGGSSVRGGSRLPIGSEFPARAADRLATLGAPAEVLNLGRPGLDSADLAAIVPAGLEFAPSVVVLYTGHNDLGNGLMTRLYARRTSLVLAQAETLASRLRTVSLLRRGLRLARQPRTPRVEYDLAADMGKESLASSAAAQTLIAAAFEQNLRDVARAVARAEARLVLLTPISDWGTWGPMNTRCHPLPAHEIPARVAELDIAIASCPACAELLFERGCLKLRMADPNAEADLLAAREADPRPLRANRPITDAIRRVAAEHGAVLVDLEREVTTEAGVPPPSAFMDVLHLSAEGHATVGARLADALAPLLRAP